MSKMTLARLLTAQAVHSKLKTILSKRYQVTLSN